ncbi:ankyrin repeat domain-containing protein [Leucothrix mucor]|uniref:ankyrin repeat domain-containing protein n=1 Tax=Leucothrix mucor TaxID=45248 RepID=UPI0003B6A3D4|nr:ankyrin repeat domain-containing protein [Leucothrix mucor]
MGRITLGGLLLTILMSLHGPANAVEFKECAKFINKNEQKYLQCTEYSFIEATKKGDYQKASQWLNEGGEDEKQNYNKLLSIFMCESYEHRGSRPFKGNREDVIRLIDDLLDRGASFHSMPTDIVTPLYCLTNRKDSVILEHVITRTNITSERLNISQYEGTDPNYLPLHRAIMNDDLESAKVLVKYGASPDTSSMFNETALKKALELHNVRMANWLLDTNSSVHKRDDERGCSGKSALDYALEIPPNVEGRDQLVERIEALMQIPATKPCR